MAGARAENWDAAAAALSAGRAGVIWRRLIADCETPVGAAAKLIEDVQYRRHCVNSLAIDDGAGLLAGLKQLIKFLKQGPGS